MSQITTDVAASTDCVPPTFGEAFTTWTRIGLLSFGGPTAQIALMHKVIVDEKKWLTEQQYLNALSFCMLLPGPEAMQLATYSGWRLHGLRGGLAAGLMFVLPGALVVLALAMIYTAFGKVPFVEAIFFGVKAAVLVIVIEALLRVAKRALKLPEHWAIAALSFVAIFFFAVPFPVIVLAAALFGFFRAMRAVVPVPFTAQVPFGETARTIVAWLAIWFVPLFAVAAVYGREHVLTQLGWFFSKLAVVTFGGAYAVLAYMGQDVVDKFHWLDAGQMMDGLGLAETTPGPLILVTEYVGFLTGYRWGDVGGASWKAGVIGAAIALWATFAPCFMWIFVGAPYIEWINQQPRLKGALTAITAAVVGVILNLAVWFGLHVLFEKVTLIEAGYLRLWTPTLASIDWRVVVLSGLSAYLLLQRHWGIPAVLTVTSTLAVVMAFGLR
jgi:chromate transporter